LTAILGYSDLLADDQAIPEKNRALAAKIRDQARRTKTLVQNLLSFARQVPAERTLLDLNTVVSNAVQLRALDLRSGTTKVELQLESVLPGVRGDGNLTTNLGNRSKLRSFGDNNVNASLGDDKTSIKSSPSTP